MGTQNTNEMFDAICKHVDAHPGCTARDIGKALYFKFHTGPQHQFPQGPPPQFSGRLRDWARTLMRILEKGGDVLAKRQGHIICYYLVDEEDNELSPI